MQRFFLPQDAIDGENILFPKAISHQILQVLRMDTDTDRVAIINPEGEEYLVRLNGHADGLVKGFVLGVLPPNAEPMLKLVLCFSLSRREKVELILQKCTEIGVFAFQPFISSRSLIQNNNLDTKRLTRWQVIIREACEQAHRQHEPELRPVLAFGSLVTGIGQGHLKYLAWEEAKLTDKLVASELLSTNEKTYLLIGPEGGLSPEEAATAKDAGWRVISLGKTILRMETACIAASAIALHLGEAE
jgi:16S rRNA (uracil1498-N3)-methyltransferase